MIVVCIVVLLIVAAAMIVARAPLARAQATLAGGSFPPALVVAEAAVLLAVALAVAVAWKSGFLK